MNLNIIIIVYFVIIIIMCIISLTMYLVRPIPSNLAKNKNENTTTSNVQQYDNRLGVNYNPITNQNNGITAILDSMDGVGFPSDKWGVLLNQFSSASTINNYCICASEWSLLPVCNTLMTSTKANGGNSTDVVYNSVLEQNNNSLFPTMIEVKNERIRDIIDYGTDYKYVSTKSLGYAEPIVFRNESSLVILQYYQVVYSFPVFFITITTNNKNNPLSSRTITRTFKVEYGKTPTSDSKFQFVACLSPRHFFATDNFLFFFATNLTHMTLFYAPLTSNDIFKDSRRYFPDRAPFNTILDKYYMNKYFIRGSEDILNKRVYVTSFAENNNNYYLCTNDVTTDAKGNYILTESIERPYVLLTTLITGVVRGMSTDNFYLHHDILFCLYKKPSVPIEDIYIILMSTRNIGTKMSPKYEKYDTLFPLVKAIDPLLLNYSQIVKTMFFKHTRVFSRYVSNYIYVYNEFFIFFGAKKTKLWKIPVRWDSKNNGFNFSAVPSAVQVFKDGQTQELKFDVAPLDLYADEYDVRLFKDGVNKTFEYYSSVVGVPEFKFEVNLNNFNDVGFCNALNMIFAADGIARKIDKPINPLTPFDRIFLWYNKDTEFNEESALRFYINGQLKQTFNSIRGGGTYEIVSLYNDKSNLNVGDPFTTILKLEREKTYFTPDFRYMLYCNNDFVLTLYKNPVVDPLFATYVSMSEGSRLSSAKTIFFDVFCKNNVAEDGNFLYDKCNCFDKRYTVEKYFDNIAIQAKASYENNVFCYIRSCQRYKSVNQGIKDLVGLVLNKTACSNTKLSVCSAYITATERSQIDTIGIKQSCGLKSLPCAGSCSSSEVCDELTDRCRRKCNTSMDCNAGEICSDGGCRINREMTNTIITNKNSSNSDSVPTINERNNPSMTVLIGSIVGAIIFVAIIVVIIVYSVRKKQVNNEVSQKSTTS